MHRSFQPADGSSPSRLRFGWVARLAGWMLVGMFSAGCATTEHHTPPTSSDARPENIFTYPPVLPTDLRRVALLPIACEEPGSLLVDGCETLRPVCWRN
ncbi:MAG: hypothetical protein WDM80_15615 [Limisphaerales bacterium]